MPVGAAISRPQDSAILFGRIISAPARRAFSQRESQFTLSIRQEDRESAPWGFEFEILMPSAKRSVLSWQRCTTRRTAISTTSTVRNALNLKDSGCDVCVGLRAGSKNWKNAEEAGLKVMTIAEAAKWGDIVMMLINDEVQADVYKKDIAPNLEDGNALAFAHGFNIRYQQIVPPKGVDVFMAAPKGPGHTVRSTYVNGKGVPCLVAVEQNATGDALKIALAYIAGIGGARAGIMETTFHDETETDLFGEQAVLCGGVVDLMRCGFETLVEAGYEPENAYFECIHEMKLIIDLINKGGVAAMNYSISDTAEFGEYVSGPRVLPYEETKKNMRAVLSDIQDGTFAGKWIAENKNGRTFFNSKRAQLAKHQMETVGAELRKNMLWGDDTDLDTASN